MLMYVEPTNADPVNCPYIDGNKFRQRYTVVKDLTGADFDMFLLNGWRHFGNFFFMPNCDNCNACRPIRTLVSEFKASKSQRRNFNKNNNSVEVAFSDLVYSQEIYNVYKKHSDVKFDQETTEKEFRESFFKDALMGSSKLSLYKIENILVGVGFIDISDTGISSIYFCYDTDYRALGLGVFSVIKEIEYAKSIGKSYYYLGYYIEGNKSMEYKNKYTPSEVLDWEKNRWVKFK
ncbi:MAG: arginyltransferase [Spirochaetaceae bacterium]